MTSQERDSPSVPSSPVIQLTSPTGTKDTPHLFGKLLSTGTGMVGSLLRTPLSVLGWMVGSCITSLVTAASHVATTATSGSRGATENGLICAQTRRQRRRGYHRSANRRCSTEPGVCGVSEDDDDGHSRYSAEMESCEEEEDTTHFPSVRVGMTSRQLLLASTLKYLTEEGKATSNCCMSVCEYIGGVPSSAYTNFGANEEDHNDDVNTTESKTLPPDDGNIVGTSRQADQKKNSVGHNVFVATNDSLIEVDVGIHGCEVVGVMPNGVSGDCVGVGITDGSRIVVGGAVTVKMHATTPQEAMLVREKDASVAPKAASFLSSIGGVTMPRATSWSVETNNAADPSVLGGAHANSILCVAASPDGYVATGGCDAAVVLWSTDMLNPLAVLVNEHADWVRYVGFSEVQQPAPSSTSTSQQHSHRFSGTFDDVDGPSSAPPPPLLQLVSGSDDGQLISWNARRGERLNTFRMRDNHRLHAATQLYSDGQLFVYGDDECVFLLEQQSMALMGTFTPHRGSVTALALSADESILVSGGEDECVIVTRLHYHPAVPSTPTDETITTHQLNVGTVEATQLTVCTSFVPQRRCVSFMTCVTSLAILSGPPDSTTALVVVATASDGSFVHWVIDTRSDEELEQEQRQQQQQEEGNDGRNRDEVEEQPSSLMSVEDLDRGNATTPLDTVPNAATSATTDTTAAAMMMSSMTSSCSSMGKRLLMSADEMRKKTMGRGGRDGDGGEERRNISVRKYEWGLGPLTGCVCATPNKRYDCPSIPEL